MLLAGLCLLVIAAAIFSLNYAAVNGNAEAENRQIIATPSAFRMFVYFLGASGFVALVVIMFRVAIHFVNIFP